MDNSKQHNEEWFDHEAFWQDLYPFMFPQKRFDDAVEEVDKILELTKPKGKAVLDLCCGPGRFSIAFAKRGFTVTGVDKTIFLLDKAKEKAKASKADIEWVYEDMRDFVRNESFDLALSMFTSFGYFDNKQEDILVLMNILESLKPGGSCLIDVVGKEWLAKVFQPTISEQLPDGSTLVQRHEVFDDWTRIRNEWILIKEGRAKSYRFHHTIYSGQELRDRLELVGFHNVKILGSLDGEPYGPESIRLIALGQKP